MLEITDKAVINSVQNLLLAWALFISHYLSTA